MGKSIEDTVATIRVGELRRCASCGALDYIGRILRRSSASVNAQPCSYCGANEFLTVQGVTRFQLDAFGRFHERYPTAADEDRDLGKEGDGPIWYPGWCEYSVSGPDAVQKPEAPSLALDPDREKKR